MPRTELTKRQQAILGYISRFTHQWGDPPTIRQIMQQFGIRSPNGVCEHLKALQKKGRVTWEHGRHGTLKVLPQEG